MKGDAAHAVPSVPAGRAGKYLVIQIDGDYFALKAERIRAVIPGAEISAGAVTVSGRAVRVIHAGPLLNASGKRRATGTTFVVVVETHGRRLGIEVETIGELIDVRERDIRNDVVQLRMNGRAYGRAKRLLDPDGLFTTAELDRLLSIRAV